MPLIGYFSLSVIFFLMKKTRKMLISELEKTAAVTTQNSLVACQRQEALKHY